jgi:hypothetical protein
MKKRLMVSALVAAAGLLSGLVAAQEVGKVISSTPVLKRVTEPRSDCSNDSEGRQRCTTRMVTEDRQIGYKVVYEYAGRQYTAQLPFAPGTTIPLEVNVSPAEPGYQSSSAPQQVYSSQPPVVVERVVREPVYVDAPYYPVRTYPAYAYDPVWPFVGLALGYTVGSWGHGWRGGYGGYGYRGWRR